MNSAAIVLAAGSGLRMGTGLNKAYVKVADRPLLSFPLMAFQRSSVGTVVIVIRPDDRAMADEALTLSGCHKVAAIVDGGATRTASEQAGVAALAKAEVDVIMIHDAARPFVPPDLIDDLALAAAEVGGAVPVLPPAGPVWRRRGDTLSRIDGDVVRVQTPQAFRADVLRGAYHVAATRGWGGADTAEIIQRAADVAVATVPGHPWAFKITYPDDLTYADTIAREFLASASERHQGARPWLRPDH